MPDVPVLTRRFPANCVANPTFQLLGDGSEVQFCAHVHRAVNIPFPVVCMLTLSTGFVGYEYLDTIIVAHQGTDKKKL